MSNPKPDPLSLSWSWQGDILLQDYHCEVDQSVMKTTAHLKRKLLETLSGKTTRKFTGVLPRASGLLACIGITCTIGSGCGVLGEKKAAERILSQNNSACLDNMGPLLNDFLDGNVAEDRWVSTWNCVDDTIDLFKKFVQGSNESSYSPEDLRFLTQKFLFSKNQVTSAFIEGLLSVKASLLGGSDQNLTKDELDQYRRLVRFVRDESLKLIPHLRNRKVNPTPENLRNFANAVETFGIRFADYLNTSKNPKLTIEKGVLFMRELASVGLKISPDRIEEWTRFGNELKYLMLKGANDGVAGEDWAKILKVGFKAGGAMMAYMDAQGDDPLFQTEMVDRIHGVLKDSLSYWGGTLPFTQIDKIIDHTPRELMPRLADDFRIGMKAIIRPRTKKLDNGKTQTFRPALAKLFASKSDLGIDAYAIQRLVDTYHTAMRGNAHLKAIYADTKEDLYPADFEARAKAYAKGLGLSDQNDVNRLITLARRYPGLHPADTPEILFQGQEKHSLNNLNRMNWYELAAGLLLDSYGTGSDEYGKAAVLGDLTLLIEDLTPLFFSIGMNHPLKEGVDKKRFMEANLFMPNGNGDDKMNLTEASVYFAYIFSASRQSSRIIELTVKGKIPCPMRGWNIPLKQETYDIQCFRNRWLASTRDMFMNMPRLQDEYEAMNQEQKDEFYHTLEYASKMTGYDNQPITTFDATSFAGLPHFAEAVMQKFDRNGDGSLDRDETLDYAFPVFKRKLSEITKLKIDFVNKAAILYLMQNGKKPGVGNFLTWALTFQFLKKFNARRIRVYQIFAALTEPAKNPDPISQTPPPGVPESSTALGFIADSLVKGLVPPEYSSQPAPTRSLASLAPRAYTGNFKLETVDPAQLEGYSADGPVIDPASEYQEALEVLPQDL